jgi:hypothetical protein
MKIRFSIALCTTAALLVLLGCAAPLPAPPPAESSVPLIGFTVPAERPAQLCQISTRCLDLDTKPFGPCLLSTEPCARDAQPMLVAPAMQFLIDSK